MWSERSDAGSSDRAIGSFCAMWREQGDRFIGCEAPYEAARIVLYGAPMDSTASYRPGSRFGPKAIRSESYGLETYSPQQDRDLTDIAVFDGGDLELPIGDAELALAAIERAAARILDDGKLPFLLGGEHLVTLAPVRACAKRFPDLRIIHVDAHADLRDDYLGVRLSHACVIRRCWDLLGDGRIYQFGIRSGDREEFRWAEAGHTSLRLFDFTNLEKSLAEIGAAPVYLTIDLDVLDPAVLPGTGTPEAGGVTYNELLTAIRAVCAHSRIVGCDLVELAPGLDPSGVSTATAGKLVRELLLALPEGLE